MCCFCFVFQISTFIHASALQFNMVSSYFIVFWFCFNYLWNNMRAFVSQLKNKCLKFYCPPILLICHIITVSSTQSSPTIMFHCICIIYVRGIYDYINDQKIGQVWLDNICARAIKILIFWNVLDYIVLLSCRNRLQLCCAPYYSFSPVLWCLSVTRIYTWDNTCKYFRDRPTLHIESIIS